MIQLYAALIAFISVQLLFFINSAGDKKLAVGLIFTVTILQGLILLYLFNFHKFSLWNSKFKAIIVVAILARLITMFSTPILEDDFHRYRWDGHVYANGINPYIHAPNSTMLDHLNTDYRIDIGYINIPTIYPPLAQYMFAFNSFAFGGSLMGLKIIFILFDLATGFLLIKWLNLRNINIGYSLFYFLNPVVIKEIANSAHLDSILAFFFALSIYYLEKLVRSKNNHISPFLLALAVLIKVTPIFAIPAIFKFSKNKFSSLGVFAVTLIALSLPFAFGDKFMPGFGSFAKHWVNNESLFYPISYLATKAVYLFGLDSFMFVKKGLLTEMPGKLVAGLILLFVIAYGYFKSAFKHPSQYCLLIITSLLLLSPVFNPWYVLWFLPFAIICKHPPTILLSMLLCLSYSWYLEKNTYYLIRAFEYLVFFSYLAFWHWHKNKIPKKSV